MTKLTTTIALIAILSFVTGCNRQSMEAKAQAPAAVTVEAQAKPTPAPAKKERFYCGVITKAGTPCRHIVKRQGDHCWQHGG